jgi:3-hydroxyacyl-[acyl-carrier-protein] dehydratase
MDVMQIQKILPHRFPFLLIDRVLEIEDSKSIKAFKNITINEHIFEGHFPDHPIYPGVMIIEGLAQAGGVLAFSSMSESDKENIENKVVYFMSIDKAKFRTPVRPGDRLDYELEVIKHKGSIWVLSGKALVDGKVVAEAELKAMVVDK